MATATPGFVRVDLRVKEPTLRRIMLGIIRGYQRAISPLLPASCRFVPSCSEYGYEAIHRYGTIRGGYMAVRRILRCNPFHPGGYDPVPVPDGEGPAEQQDPARS